MKQQAIILSVIALASTVCAAGPNDHEIFFPQKFTLSGVLFQEN